MMKNTLLAALFIFALGNLCRIGLPWWGIVPIAALAGWFFPRRSWSAFFAGFLGAAMLWSLSAWWADNANEGLLSAKVGELFMGASPEMLMGATGLIGGLLGGFASLSGRLLKESLVKPRRKSYLQERRR